LVRCYAVSSVVVAGVLLVVAGDQAEDRVVREREVPGGVVSDLAAVRAGSGSVAAEVVGLDAEGVVVPVVEQEERVVGVDGDTVPLGGGGVAGAAITAMGVLVRGS
jgi:hypothetical protein